MAIKIVSEKCIGCGICIDSCPVGAIELVNGIAIINQDTCTGCGACINSCPCDAIEAQGEEAVAAKPSIDDYRGVWVYAEQRDGKLMSTVIELLGEGRKLASDLNVELSAVLIGNTVSSCIDELAAAGANRVIVADNPILANYTTDGYAKVFADLINTRKPEIVLIGATNIGRDLGPRLAARLHTGLTADCTKLDIDPETRGLLQTRPAFGGNVMATIITPNHRPQMATVRPGVMQKAAMNPENKAEVEYALVELDASDIRTTIVETVKAVKHQVNLVDADIIVSGGRGVGSEAGFELITALANELGGVVGASRAAVESGYIAPDHQVGQTGKTVRPKLYIACGISGAIQHIAGMQNSGCIVAINTNPEAPIFKVADYGICGDLTKVIPMIIEELRQRA